jgi:hypothetical protein
MKAHRWKWRVSEADRCLECPRPWCCITILPYATLFRCMTCWGRYYKRSRGV